MDSGTNGQRGKTGWRFTSEHDGITEQTAQSGIRERNDTIFQWTAFNGSHRHKSPGWYFLLTLVTAIIAGIAYLLTSDKITTAAILVCGIALGIYASKRPSQVKYTLDSGGFKINDRYFSLSAFRSFSIVTEGGQQSAVLTPLKRFMPYVYIYFAPDMESPVIETLGNILPRQSLNLDLLDRFMKFIGL